MSKSIRAYLSKFIFVNDKFRDYSQCYFDISPGSPEIDSSKKYKIKQLLYTYNLKLGVEEYKEENNIIEWCIGDTWYSSDQIDQLLKLKAFL